ncbi:MAG: DUF1624 domain-containing protein [Candidatus Lokiarchaeota archaeon]|nr:DUF1624 domain-containing protein [Candidatus Lokiarchaeota archaeon]
MSSIVGRRVIMAKKTKYRIQTFDLIRSIAIILMILAHVLDQWLVTESQWIAAILYLILSPMGVPGFMFCAGLGFGFSWQKNESKGYSRRRNTLYSLSRSIIILGIAIGYNLVGVIVHNRAFYDIWFWYILQTIAISRIIGLIFTQLSVKGKLISALLIIIVTHFLLFWMLDYMDTSSLINFFYILCFNSIDADSILFFLPFFITGMVFGEIIYEFYIGKIKIDLKKWAIFGLIIMLIGIFTGLNPASYYYGWNRFLDQLSLHPALDIKTLPLFLSRNSYAWILYSLGGEIMLLAGMFYKIDLKLIENQLKNKLEEGLKDRRKKDTTEVSGSLVKKPTSSSNEKLLKNNNDIQRTLAYKIFIRSPQLFGKYSLSIYLIHYLAYLLPFEFTHKLILIAFLIFCLAIWLCIFIIDKYAKGRISVEFLIGWGSMEIYKTFKQIGKQDQKPTQ